MKEPKRLLSHGATDFERQLLRAVVSERPSALLRSRMQRGLGLVGPLAWASNVKAMFGSAASRMALGVAVAGVVAAGGFGAMRLLSGSSEVPPAEAERDLGPELVAAPPLVAAPVVEAPVVEVPVVAAPVVREAAVVAEAAPVEAAVREPVVEAEVPAVEAVSAADDDDGRLREEIALLDAVRAALQRGDREAALGSLEIYRERFPMGILRREANVLRGRAEAAAAEK